MMEPRAKFRQVVEERHSYAQEWKARTGGKVIGYLCTYVPEEIIYAAGILPVRILGSHEPQDITDIHIYGMYCAYSRDCLAQGLKGDYHYLDGIVTAHSCMHIRQAFDSWRRHIPINFNYYLYIPAHIINPSAKICIREEFKSFKEALEEWTGNPISNQAMDEAIEIYNTNRRLMRQIYALRKRNQPPISGTEAMEMVMASMFMDKKEHNDWLKPLLDDLLKQENGSLSGVRLMIVGSENDDLSLLQLAESLGANLVIDDHCTGSRYFWNEIIPGEDRLQAIANRYIERPLCPQKDLVERRRLSHILQLAREYNIQGVILIQQKFCDPHGYDLPLIKSLLKDHHIPALELETDITIPVGQFRTRVEAFIEMIEQAI
jgi:benzoyl-CoA reductase subunit C